MIYDIVIHEIIPYLDKVTNDALKECNIKERIIIAFPYKNPYTTIDPFIYGVTYESPIPSLIDVNAFHAACPIHLVEHAPRRTIQIDPNINDYKYDCDTDYLEWLIKSGQDLNLIEIFLHLIDRIKRLETKYN